MHKKGILCGCPFFIYDGILSETYISLRCLFSS